MQDFKLGDVVDANALYLGFLTSRSFGIINFYGGIGYESAKLRIQYEDIDYDVKANNSIRFILGTGLNLPGINIHADYNIASQNVLAIGAGFDDHLCACHAGHDRV
jgi:hypothetical protein